MNNVPELIEMLKSAKSIDRPIWKVDIYDGDGKIIDIIEFPAELAGSVQNGMRQFREIARRK